MGKRPSLFEEFCTQAAQAFSFLVENAGFTGPEATDNGLRFRRPGLVVDSWFLNGHEPGVMTGVSALGPDGAEGRTAWLDDLYVAAGCGPTQDVPGQAPNRRSTLKRVGRHTGALQRLLPYLLGPGSDDLIARSC
ncbi:hypothetical protein ACFCWV_23355 [Streptomyces sp. NPDC056341]|uniref:hypothetical protein n=1 Tax=Streptomyces sp. NPDC056341 TaxID=3345788 RepID=UPI0035DC9261